MNAELKTMGADEVAKLALGEELRPSSYKTINTLARNGELRGRKVGKKWRFLESEVRGWLTHRNGY